MIDQIKNIKSGKNDLRNFGVTIGTIFIIITIYYFYVEDIIFQSIFGIGVTLISIALVLPNILKPFYLIWMIFSVILSFIMTRLILIILFFFVISPIGIVSRIFGKDFIGIRNNKFVTTYWVSRDSLKKNIHYYDKQF